MQKTKKILVVLLVAVMFIQVTGGGTTRVKAATNATAASVTLSFSNGKAKCGASVIGKTGVNKIKGTLKLKKVEKTGTKTIKSWDVNVKTKNLSVSKSYAVPKGQYKVVLSVDVYKGGKAQHITISVMKFRVS